MRLVGDIAGGMGEHTKRKMRIDRFAATTLAAVAVAGFCILIWMLGSALGGQSERRLSSNHSHAVAAQRKILDECRRRPADEHLACLEEEVRASEQMSLTEQDLTAQQRAAWGAMIAGGSGILGVLLSAFALLYLRDTLMATAEAARAATAANVLAERNAEREFRAYLSAADNTVTVSSEDTAKFTIRIVNDGIAQAKILSCKAYAWVSTLNDLLVSPSQGVWQNAYIPPIVRRQQHANLNAYFSSSEVNRIRCDPNVLGAVIFHIVYDNGFDKHKHLSSGAYWSFGKDMEVFIQPIAEWMSSD